MKSNGENNDQTDHLVALSHDGNCSLSYAEIYKTTCEINVRYFPFDEHSCDLLFGSWGMDDRLLRLRSTNDKVRGKEYRENGEWDLVSATPSVQQVCLFACLTGPCERLGLFWELVVVEVQLSVKLTHTQCLFI